MKLVDNWYSIDILPLYLSLSEEKLQAAQQQLSELKQQSLPIASVVKRTIKLCEKRSKTACIILKQCNRWRRQVTSQNQIMNIVRLKKNTKDLEKINQQILNLVRNLQNSDADYEYDTNVVLNSLLIAHGWE
jgi:lipopolysaccharide biosynthesis glycosyltransferase